MLNDEPSLPTDPHGVTPGSQLPGTDSWHQSKVIARPLHPEVIERVLQVQGSHVHHWLKEKGGGNRRISDR